MKKLKIILNQLMYYFDIILFEIVLETYSYLVFCFVLTNQIILIIFNLYYQYINYVIYQMYFQICKCNLVNYNY